MPTMLEKQRDYRRANGNAVTKRYEKTKSGMLMRLYRNMKSRIEGVQAKKFHLYAGKDLLPKAEFYAWALEQPEFHRLFAEWTASGHERRLAPSVDRIDPAVGYLIGNMEWVTMGENSRRGGLHRVTRHG